MRKLLLILFIIPLIGFSQIVTSGGKVVTTSSGLVSLSGGATPTPPSYDADAQAYFDLADQATLTTAQKDAINTFVVAEKADGLWTKTDAYYLMIGGTATMHKYNLKDPRDLDAAYRLTFYGGLVHSSTGVLPNGSNTYAVSHLSDFDLAQNSVHLSYYSRTSGYTGSFSGEFGAGAGTNFYMTLNYNNTSVKYASNINNSGIYSITASGESGYFLSSRLSSAGLDKYKNGSNVQNVVATSATPTAGNIDLFRMQTTEYSYRECAFASIGSGLDATEQSNRYDNVQALQTALGREITP